MSCPLHSRLHRAIFRPSKTSALAALAVVSAASAQSSVTLSGNIDLGYSSLTEKATDSTIPASIERKRAGQIGNGAAGWTSSMLKLTVSEDLGSGLKAGFVGEMNVFSVGAGTDTANQLLGTARQSYVNVSGGFGEVKMGYIYTTDDQIQGGVGRATPTGNVGGRFQNFSVSIPQTATTWFPVTSDVATRTNAVEWNKEIIPGLTAIVQYGKVTDETTTSPGTTPGIAAPQGTWSGVAGKYVRGPLTLGASFAKLSTDTQTINTPNTNTATNRRLSTYAANYDFGVVKAFVNFTDRSNQLDLRSANAGKTTTKGYDIGLSAPLGATTLFAALGKGAFKANNAMNVGEANVGIKTQLLGATYDLSKRTSLNAYYAMTKANDDLENSGSAKKTNFGFGLRHQF